PGQTGAAKPFAGVTISGASFQHVYQEALKEYLPQFEEQSGMKVNLDLQAFPVYNQRTDLELSTQGSAWDFLNITFVYSGRWIGAGWFHPIEELAKDPNKTPPDWGVDDWPSGALASLKDDKGTIYGYPWEVGAMINGAGRADLVEKAGLKLPTTFDEMTKVLEAVNDQDGTKAFVADKLHHWNWIPYLMGFGGTVFKDPPGNLTPTLNTPEAIKAAEWYSNVLRSFTPEGVLSYTDDQAMTAQLQGRANMRTQAVAWMVPVGMPEKSQVAKTAGFALMPGGPAGQFPGSNSHGFGIPVGSRKKEAAWEFIKWAMSKEMVARVVTEKGYAAPCRLSVINSPEFKQKMTLNGQDVASLYTQVLELGGKTGYMKYRTVPVFPQVGDKINKAIEVIATRQMTAEDAMKQAQAEAVADLKKSGVQVDG
ncbi:MAG: extracellular solute-binding protein, partial [Chloroflexi bacterium]|nr:extracellular solute-binding protein [Chloroflexota bacterium]